MGTTRIVVGTGNLIDPAKLSHVFISPRKRAQQTFDLLFAEASTQYSLGDMNVTTTEELAEWRYGASANAFAARLDALISKIRRIQGANMHGEKASDVVLISHGHLLRGFVKRWVQLPLDVPLSLMLDPGGVGIVRYMYMTTNTIMSMSPR
ncbi:MAG: hypothetical protein Q9223_000718 [Gallowayella weberi]